MAGNTYPSQNLVDTNVVTTNETVAIVSTAVSTQYDTDVLTIEGTINFTTGASVTSVTVRVRRGNGVAGALVGETLPITVGAVVSDSIPFQFTDQPGAVAGQQYTATLQQTAATGNGTINSAAITITVGQ